MFYRYQVYHHAISIAAICFRIDTEISMILFMNEQSHFSFQSGFFVASNVLWICHILTMLPIEWKTLCYGEKSGQLFMYVLGRVSLLLIRASKKYAMQI